jgi:erythromycin esterase
MAGLRKPLGAIVVAVAFLLSFFSSQSILADTTSQEIATAYDALQTALLKDDAAALRAILAKGFQSQQVDGSIQNSDEYVKEQIEPTPGVTIATLVIVPNDVQINGKTAQAQAQYTINGTYAVEGHPKPLRGTIRTTDRWTFEGTRWKLSASTVHEIVSYVDGTQVQDDREDAMPSAAAVAGKQARAVVIPTLKLDANPDQFAAIGDAIGDARIVGMGEGSHGSSEFFAFKDRLFKYLVERKGFAVFAIEAAWGAGQVVDRYIKGGPGTAESAVQSLEFWTWNTPEVVDLVRWMHDYNAKPGTHPILSFAGFDMQNPIAPANYVSDFLKKNGASEGSVNDAMRCVYDVVASGYDSSNRVADFKGCRENVVALQPLLDAKGTLQNADIAKEAMINVLQYLDEGQGAQASISRDRDMASNVEWLATTKFPNTKIALWAHNYHIGNEPRSSTTYPSMGSYLRERFGQDYYAIGQTFGSGSVRAIVLKHGLQAVPVPAKPEDSLAALFGPSYVQFLDLRSLPSGSPLSMYFSGPHGFFEIGAVIYPKTSNYRTPTVIPNVFDGIVYSPISTATTWGVSSVDLKRDVVQNGVDWSASGPDVDTLMISGIPSGATVRNDDGIDEMSNALLRRFDATPYLGRTVRITGEVERVDLKGFANSYVCTVGSNGEVIGSRSGPTIDSSTDGKWVRFAITLTVPKKAEFVEAGISLGGPGTGKVRNVAIAMVPSDTGS